ncbi:uncharacterized protein LOC110826896 [Zootermopsis nevadensis]|uniref:Transmembrane protein 134 n=1 Tax=Zootermopsis nevadensis TaxID=136037 RepID=A0A067RF78_ZOONE|nr:uncharacterized protein LOC110826896 [Zootermopsis nevadensis]KDR22427.1 hypothetical protein L798_01421 [Zootermopsis nevadensis]
MAGVFGSRERRFTIDDAFEEENDEAIRVYGSTTERSPLKPKSRNMISEDSIIVRIEDPIRTASTITSTAPRFKTSDDATSRDSDSLIQDGGFYTGMFDPTQSGWRHPKIRENWKMVLAAVVLLIVGIGLLVTGAVVICLPMPGIQAFVFFIAGFICFIPGAYHVVYIYWAVKGKRGYDFYHLPLFN